ncbi:hypothetical protein OE749_11555 [Aestuariibacter sp. AA17]|uniref:Collagen triple helix repeat (20 copies) n=1 Tax=Fluctibacter corallii TaxID=2984329 RepID=A0ABT3A9G8_9ALTE|nr:LamG-like jellyroll fold domain-containing protein [Aestuariibacter sp. AA17]MCV2885329.1 hypothetical protein [Aestuariibacter sp. AA17]
MKTKIAIAVGLLSLGASFSALSDSMNVSYSFNNANGYPGNGEEMLSGGRGYFPLSGAGNFTATGRSGLGLSEDVMVVGGLAPFLKDMPLTLSLWIRPTSFAAGSTIISKKHTDLGQGFSLDFDGAMNLSFSIIDNNGGEIAVTSLASVPTDNLWHHVTVTYAGDANASNLAIYIDGQPAELRLDSNNLSGNVETYHPLVVGAGPSYTQAISADIDEVYMVPIAFTKDQVTCLNQLKTDCAYRPTVGTVGPRGPMGPAGEQGPRGVKGTAGADGIAGLKGDTGPEGPVGEKGPVGPKGYTGPTGPVGEDGLDGSDGKDGLNGAPGAQGPVGDTGLRGATGDTGPQGYTGPKGATGYRGAQGPQGNQGVQGSKGQKGDQGPPGYRGATGDKGLTGPRGDTGPKGYTGATGDQGPAGNPGATGNRGSSGANTVGNTGPTGDRGDTGPRGDAPQWCDEIFGFAEAPIIDVSPAVVGVDSFTDKPVYAIDPEYILKAATTTDADGNLEMNYTVLGLENEREASDFFIALSEGQHLKFIKDLYQQKGLDNRYVAIALGTPILSEAPIQPGIGLPDTASGDSE